MKLRTREILRHIVATAILIISAGAVAALVIRYWIPKGLNVAALFPALPAILVQSVAVVVASMLLGAMAPRHFLSAFAGLWCLLRHRRPHGGIVIRCLLGGFVAIGVLKLTEWPMLPHGLSGPMAFLFVYLLTLALGFFPGLVIAKLLETWRNPDQRVCGLPADVKKRELRSWLGEDKPIESADENLNAAHLQTAERILSRITAPSDEDCPVSRNVALLGGYGSGKTSICNVVRTEYEKKHGKYPAWPSLLFCRFEAWQYTTAEATLRALIDSATSAVLKEADEPSLWSMSEHYVRAVAEVGPSWSRSLAVLLCNAGSPEVVLESLGDLLRRIDHHLIIIVDDLDRIEAASADQVQAVIQALNRFQSVPNVHYILTVGPMYAPGERDAAAKPPLDLLKLTRFQELVPRIDGEVAIGRVIELRDGAKGDGTEFYPWSTDDHRLVQMLFAGQLRPFPTQYSQTLCELLNTPRALKAALRETRDAWQGGLEGEINWYDLLLANTLKAAEPAVFEWILRDKDFFTAQSPLSLPSTLDSPKKDKDEEAKDLRHRVADLLRSSPSDERLKAVLWALRDLFPVFLVKLKPNLSVGPNGAAMQRLGSNSYLERFAAGFVPEGERDGPILAYLKRVSDGNFDPAEFERTYLGSAGSVNSPLSKLTQFAMFLDPDTTLKMCDTILDWAGRANSMRTWPEAPRFYKDACSIIGDLVGPDKPRGAGNDPFNQNWWRQVREWRNQAVSRLTPQNPLLTSFLIGSGVVLPTGEPGEKHPQDTWAKIVMDEYVTGNRPLAPVVTQYEFGLCHLLSDFEKCPAEYSQARIPITSKLIGEFQGNNDPALQREILFALTSSATFSGPISVEKLSSLAIDKDKNAKRFDMPVLEPVLREWYAKGVSDPLPQRVLRELATYYGFDGQKSA